MAFRERTGANEKDIRGAHSSAGNRTRRNPAGIEVFRGKNESMKNFSYILTLLVLLGLDLYSFTLLLISTLQDIWFGTITLDFIGILLIFIGLNCLLFYFILKK